jgi:hypothetical protein
VARIGISASQRWQVFSRDAYTCRYCGSQAGQQGVVLHVDHVLSVADGGTNAFDNLVTACQRCNQGKGARSLSAAPASEGAVDRLSTAAETLEQQADALQAYREAKEDAEQEIVNILCDAYGKDSISISQQHINQFMALVRRHGAESVAEWIDLTAAKGVVPHKAILYVHGIIRAKRADGVLS